MQNHQRPTDSYEVLGSTLELLNQNLQWRVLVVCIFFFLTSTLSACLYHKASLRNTDKSVKNKVNLKLKSKS